MGASEGGGPTRRVRAGGTVRQLALMAATAVLCLPSALPAQEDWVVHIPELSDEDLARIDIHDGSIQDWESLLGEPVLRAPQFVAVEGKSYDPADLDYRVWLGWHDASNRIFCAVERADDVYLNRFEPLSAMIDHGNWVARNHTPIARLAHDARFAGIYFQDSVVHFHVDGDNGGGLYMTRFGNLEPWRRLSNSVAQFYVAISETWDSGPRLTMGSDGGWCLYPPYSEGGGGQFGEQPSISVTEFYVTPFDELIWNDEAGSVVSELTPGKVIGLIIAIPDFDNPAARFYPPFNTLQSFPPQAWERMGNADYMARGVLMGREQSSGTAPDELPAEAWGRLKAGGQPDASGRAVP